MKTVIIYETTEEVTLFIEEGDFTKFERVFVNSTSTGLEKELGEIEFKNKIDTKQMKREILNGSLLVHCGFIY